MPSPLHRPVGPVGASHQWWQAKGPWPKFPFIKPPPLVAVERRRTRWLRRVWRFALGVESDNKQPLEEALSTYAPHLGEESYFDLI